MSRFSIAISIALLAASGCLLAANAHLLAEDTFISRLRGRILLQVEQKGEAWYIDPADGTRHYLGRPDDAFTAMRTLGLGVTDADIGRLPIAIIQNDLPDADGDGLPDAIEDSLGTDKTKADTDSDGYDDRLEVQSRHNPLGTSSLPVDERFADTVAGKILIQIERHGEAWYVNPLDRRRYYLGRPSDAFALMRSLGLGITDANLDKIAVYTPPQTYKGENIVTKFTQKLVSQPTQRRYRDPDGHFSLDYPSAWRIRKYDESPTVTHITDAVRDYISEKRAVITLNYIAADGIAEVTNFRVASKGDSKRLADAATKVAGFPAYENAYEHELAYERTTTLKINDGEFLQVNLTTAVGNEARYQGIYEELLNSVKVE